MEIIHPSGLVPFPGRTGEDASPVVGLAAVDRLPPDVVVPLGVVPRRTAFQKPRVLVGGMVDHQVHHQLQPPLVRRRQQVFEILHGAKLIHDRPVIGDVIAVVVVGGLVNRAHPDHVYPQLPDIVQLALHPAKIADAVAVAVAERAGIHLVYDAFLPPCLFHIPALQNHSIVQVYPGIVVENPGANR